MRPVLDVMAVLAEHRRLASELVRAREEIAELRRRVAFLQREIEEARATMSPRISST